MEVISDLSRFGFQELKEAAKLLTAYADADSKGAEFLGSGINIMFNTSSGYVFLTDSDYNVGMLNDGDLEQFFTCSDCGKEGFLEEWGKEEDKDDTCEGCADLRKRRKEGGQ